MSATRMEKDVNLSPAATGLGAGRHSPTKALDSTTLVHFRHGHIRLKPITDNMFVLIQAEEII